MSDPIKLAYSGSLVFVSVSVPLYVLFIVVIIKYRKKDERLSSEFFTLCVNVGCTGELDLGGTLSMDRL